MKALFFTLTLTPNKIIALYARGMSTRDIQPHIEEIFGITVFPSRVSAVTEAVMDEAAAWQNGPLELTCAIVCFDALRVKIRDAGLVRNKAVYLAIGVTCAGAKEILWLWIELTEGAKFWMRVMTEIRWRAPRIFLFRVGESPGSRDPRARTTDILIAVVHGLKGFPEAITAVFPETVVQTCRPPDPPLDAVRLLEGAPRDRKGLEADLRRARCRGCRCGPRRVRGRPSEAGSTRPSAPAGAAGGRRSSRASRSRPRSAGSSTPPMRSRACTARCARPSATRGTSRATTRRSS